MAHFTKEQFDSARTSETCDRCNYDTHVCHGCGEPLPHGIEVCPPCDVVLIPLPPEPPHDRVIEAVDQDGTVTERWEWSETPRTGYWRGCGPSGFTGNWPWDEIGAFAFRMNRSLRHVPAESGEQT